MKISFLTLKSSPLKSPDLLSKLEAQASSRPAAGIQEWTWQLVSGFLQSHWAHASQAPVSWTSSGPSQLEQINLFELLS